MLRALIRDGLVKSVHDCSEGGLAVAVAESSIGAGIGASIDIASVEARADIALFGEAQSRAVVSASADAWREIEARATAANVVAIAVGRTGGSRLQMGRINVALGDAAAAWHGGLEQALAGDGRDG